MSISHIPYDFFSDAGVVLFFLLAAKLFHWRLDNWLSASSWRYLLLGYVLVWLGQVFAGIFWGRPSW